MKKQQKFKTSKKHRNRVNAWRAANKKHIAAAAKEGMTLTAWRKKHDSKVRHAAPKAAKKAAPAHVAA